MSDCALHRSHRPTPEGYVVHHVVPLSWGGTNEGSNRVTICPTGLRNVHELLDLYVAANGVPPWPALRHFGATTRALARRAWDAALADPSITPRRTT